MIDSNYLDEFVLKTIGTFKDKKFIIYDINN